MLRSRLMAAACILVPVLALIWLDDQFNFGHPGIWLAPLAILIAQVSCWETTDLIQAGAWPVRPIAGQFGSLLVLGGALAPVAWSQYPVDCPIGKVGWLLLGVAAAVQLVFVVELVHYRQPGQQMVSLSTTLFAICYTALPLGLLVQLRIMHANRLGLLALLTTLLVVKFSDVGAYFVGKRFGKRRLAPMLSPGKSIEGAIGGIVAAAITAVSVGRLLLPWLLPADRSSANLWAWAAYGVSLGVVGIVGDLSESLLKRSVDRKDSSSWLPGLGGVLDIVDSVLPNAALSFLWWSTGWLYAADLHS